jgi:hypothetical protein
MGTRLKVSRNATGAYNVALNMMGLSGLLILAFRVLFAMDVSCHTDNWYSHN